MLKHSESFLVDSEIDEFLKRDGMNIEFIQDFKDVVAFGDYLIIATSTD